MMLNDKRKTLSYNIVSLLLILFIGCLSVFLYAPDIFALAEYDDLTQDSIVNFNQISNEIGIQHDGTIGSSGFNNHGTTYFPSSLNSSHHYLVKFYYVMNSGTVSLALFSQGYTDVIFSSDNDGYSVITGWSTISLFRAYGTVNSYYDFTAYISIIDLDLMFGSDNIPSLSQCKDLFVSDYYAYNTGTAVSLSGLNSYSQGYNDAFKSVETIIDSNLLNTNVFGVSTLVSAWEGGLSSFAFTCVKEEAPYNIAFGYNFNSTLSPGDIVSINLDGIIVTYDSSDPEPTSIDIGYYDNGNFIPLNSILFSNMNLASSSTTLGIVRKGYNSGSVSFSLNNYISSLYFRVNDCKIATFVGMNIKIRSNNYLVAIQNAYDSGYSQASTDYAVGGSKYQQIFNLGKTAGLNETNPYTFSALMSSVVEAPISAVLNIFNVDFLGYNLKNFITLLITLCLLLAIVNLFMGGK